MKPIEFNSIGGAWVDPPVLMPAALPLELSGEAVRSRLLTSSDAPGDELVLRPDLTLAVAQMHLDAETNAPTSYRYLGKAFRQPAAPGEDMEFYQTGFECFGYEDRSAQDIAAFRAIYDAVSGAGVNNIQICLGDIALFDAVVDALKLSPFWSSQVRRAFRRQDGLQNLLDGKHETQRSALASTLSELPADQAAGLLEEVLSLSGGQVIAGRTAEDILERLQSQAAAEKEGPLDSSAMMVLKELVEISGQPVDFLENVKRLVQSNGVNLDAWIEGFERFLSAFDGEAHLKNAHMSAAFGQSFDYYDGLVFELFHVSTPMARPIASGGRYDGLMKHLTGGAVDQSAVGGVIRPDRLETAHKYEETSS